MCFHFLHVGYRCGPSIIIGRAWYDLRAKLRKQRKVWSIGERDGENGGNSAWIGSLWNSNLELLTLNTPVESLRNKNVKLSTQIKGWWRNWELTSFEFISSLEFASNQASLHLMLGLKCLIREMLEYLKWSVRFHPRETHLALHLVIF